MTIYIFLILYKIWTSYYPNCLFFYPTSWVANLRARWPDFLPRRFQWRNSLYVTHSTNFLSLVSYFGPNKICSTFFLMCMKTTSVNTMQNYCGKFFTQFELSFPSFNYLNWVHFNFLTLNLYFNRGKKLSNQSQQNLYYLSEALATCFGLIMPLSGHCTRQISGIM